MYDEVSTNLVHQFQAALKAKELFKRDKDYVVQHGEVKIVDEFTGRILEGRRWSEGLHQAVEAKEGVKINEENQTLATDHAPELLPPVRQVGRDDRYGRDRGVRARQHLQPARRADPHQPADGPRSTRAT